jgi:glycerate dehydrogenase
MKAVLLDADTLGNDIDLADLSACFDSLELHANTRSDETMQRLLNVDVVLTNKVVINKDHLDASPSIKLIVILATGSNCIDIQAASNLGVTVCNIRDYSTPSVVQHTLLLMLALLAKLPQHSRAIASGEWQRSDTFCLLSPSMTELAGKSVLIVGYGTLGQAVAHVLRAMGAKIQVAIRPGSSERFSGKQETFERDGRVPLDKALADADLVSLHCQLSEQTESLFDAQRLALMKPSALLINTARGGIVDEQALANALLKGRLGGAGIDVLETEPPRDSNPLLDLIADNKAVLQRENKTEQVAERLPAEDINLIITAHCAWATKETRCRLIAAAVKVVLAFKAGQPINQLN